MYRESMIIFAGWDGHDTLQELYEYDAATQFWYPLPPRGTPPAARYRHSAVLYGNSRFTFGGVDKAQNRFADLFEFDMVERTWSEVMTTGEPPTPRTFHKSVVHDGHMYILGGFDGYRQNDTYRVYLQSSQTSNHNSMASAGDASQTNQPDEYWKWQVVESANEPYSARTGHGVVVWRHYFYLFGGTDENARQNDLYEFNLQTYMWRQVTSTGTPPSARSGAKAVVYRDAIFLFGGYTKKDGEYFNDVYRFDIRDSRWTRLDCQNPPSVRTDHTCTRYSNFMYIFGGFDGKSRFQDVQELDMETSAWTSIPQSENQPMGRFGHTACMYKTSIYVFGGWNGHDTLDDLNEFSVTTKQFYSVPGRGDVPSSRYRHSAVVYGCCMFVFGGVDKRQARFADLHEFNFDLRVWSGVQTTGDVPSARTFHRAVMYNGSMYLLGGFDGVRRADMYRVAIPEIMPKDEKALRRGKTEDKGGNAPEDWSGGQDGEKGEVGRLKLQVLELQKRLEMEEERHICKICYEREINTVILGCNHRVICSRCLESLNALGNACPICRGVAETTLVTIDCFS
jgi:N-acetylneuraminic acid mutarotase